MRTVSHTDRKLKFQLSDLNSNRFNRKGESQTEPLLLPPPRPPLGAYPCCLGRWSLIYRRAPTRKVTPLSKSLSSFF